VKLLRFQGIGIENGSVHHDLPSVVGPSEYRLIVIPVAGEVESW
jgi:hypothetical protein